MGISATTIAPSIIPATVMIATRHAEPTGIADTVEDIAVAHSMWW